MSQSNPKLIPGSLALFLLGWVLAPALAAQDPPPEERQETYYDKFGHGHGHGHGHGPGHGQVLEHGHGHGHGGHGHGHGFGRGIPPAPEPVDVDAAPRVTWTNAEGGSWSDAGNWSGGTVPGVNDHAVIDLAGTYTVVVDADTRVTALSLGAASGTQTLAIPRDALALRGPATIGPRGVVELAGGRITGDGDLVVQGEMEWSGGAMSGRGKARVEAGGRLAIVGDERKVLSLRHVENSGTMVWSGAGNLVVTFAAQIVNREGASFEISSGALLDVYGPAGPSVTNAGTLRVTSELIPRFETPLVNTGTLELERGGLHLLDGYSGDGEVVGDGKLQGLPAGRESPEG